MFPGHVLALFIAVLELFCIDMMKIELISSKHN